MWKAKDLRRYRLISLGLALLLFAAAVAMALAVWSRGSGPRVANDTLRLPWSPLSDTAWTTENAYPHLKFFEPTCIVFAHDSSRRVFVLERRGTVQMFNDDAGVDESVQILDIADHVWRTAYEDDGAVAIALHPQFGQADSPNKDYFYLLYTAKIGDKRYDRLSRFTLHGEQASDELVLIDQLDEDLWHNGGGLVFGPDGFLYVGVGDEGTNGDGLKNGQLLDRDLYCGVLRIDVDRRGGDISRPPLRQPDTGKTAGYFVPKDNPFVDVPGALHEFWAHGLRNPYRLAFDEETGRLWAADVGHLRREEVNIIRPSGNYGWSHREGTLPFTESYLHGNAPTPRHGEEIDPVWEYPHLNGNNCIIGGFVYRGEKYPQLEGKYIYADNGSGRVWALAYEEGQPASNEELLSLPVSSKTGIASVQPDADGEPLIVILGESGTTSGTIRRIIAADKDAATTLPGKLSETGIFADIQSLTPKPGVIPYEVNAPQTAGEARIRRWIAVPGDGRDPDSATDRIEIAADGAWKFPTGTVSVQHFDLPVVKNNSQHWQPVETRVLVRTAGGGVYALSYKWNAAGTDAELVREPEVQAVTVREADGSTHEQSWQFLDRQTCLACHNANAGFILGVNARQLNRERNGHNQLLDLSDDGYFRQPLNESEIAAVGKLIAPHDADAPLDLRARSYLDANCAACHREGGAHSKYFAEFDRTANPAALSIKPTQGDFGIADAQIIAPGDPFRSVLYYRLAKLGQGRMPPVGSHEIDRDGLKLLRSWLEQLDAPDDAQAPAQDETIADLITGAIQPSGSDADAAINELLSDTRSAFALWQAIDDVAIAEPLRSQIIARGAASESAAVRDLYEWFVDPQDRTQRLGPNFDPLLVLQQAGDAERGRELYANKELVTCSNCHASQSSEPSIGPSLAGIGRKFTRGELLQHITDPSLRIDPQFATWMVETSSGRLHHGLLVSRTDDEIVLKDAEGAEHRIAASDVEFMKKQSRSMMPDQLLQSLTPAQAADLLAYLQTLE